MGGQDGRRVELLNGVGVGAGSGSQEVLVSGTRILKMRCRFDAAVAIPVWTQARRLYRSTRRKSPSRQLQRKAESRFICQNTLMIVVAVSPFAPHGADDNDV